MATTSTASARRKHIDVRGIVQGVGFRPFVYKLAHSLGLTGYVFNSSSGVTIEIEGGEAEIATFLETAARRTASAFRDRFHCSRRRRSSRRRRLFHS